MSVRGPRGGRGRGAGRGRGRGRGAKTTMWEWENYTPGPEVYDQLWYIRKEPAAVTPYLSNDCPIANARTRLLDRRQTEGDVQRNFYVVEITRLPARDTSTSCDDDEASTETEHVDVSYILQYVSSAELERFENEQFRVEAEAEAIAARVEAETLARRRLERNARMSGTGKGSRMLSGLGLGPEVRARGRPRARGRGRGSWRGRGALAINDELHDGHLQEELVDAEVDEALYRGEEAGDDLHRIIAETDSEDDFGEAARAQPSPGIARSAFVANSALPVSPVIPHRRPTGAPINQRHVETPGVDSDLELSDSDARSMSSADMQLRIEGIICGPSGDFSVDESTHHDQHRSKRRRTESTVSKQRISLESPSLPMRLPAQSQSQASTAPTLPATDSDEQFDYSAASVPAGQPSSSRRNSRGQGYNGMELDNAHAQFPHSLSPTHVEKAVVDEEEDDDAKEYIVQKIIEHFYEAGRKYYLVKWAGYENSHDWLPEEDLEGASEMVADYNRRIRKKPTKKRMG